jgi:hypothetical protein
MQTPEVLDRFTVELVISPAFSDEEQRDILRRLDASPLFAIAKARLQQCLNASGLEEVQAIIRR